MDLFCGTIAGLQHTQTYTRLQRRAAPKKIWGLLAGVDAVVSSQLGRGVGAAPAFRCGRSKIILWTCTSQDVRYDPPPMNIPVRVGETIEGSRTMRNRPYQVLTQVLKSEEREREISD